jgi:hypothetical protein
MQPTIHCNKKPDIEAVNVRVFLLMNCGCIFYSARLIIPRKSPCIVQSVGDKNGRCLTKGGVVMILQYVGTLLENQTLLLLELDLK